MTSSTYLKLFPPLVSSRLVRIRRSVLYSRLIDSCSSFLFDLRRFSLRSFALAGPGFVLVVVCPDRSRLSPLSRPFSSISTVLLCFDRSSLLRPFSFLVSVVAALIWRQRRIWRGKDVAEAMM